MPLQPSSFCSYPQAPAANSSKCLSSSHDKLLIPLNSSARSQCLPHHSSARRYASDRKPLPSEQSGLLPPHSSDRQSLLFTPHGRLLLDRSIRIRRRHLRSLARGRLISCYHARPMSRQKKDSSPKMEHSTREPRNLQNTKRSANIRHHGPNTALRRSKTSRYDKHTPTSRLTQNPPDTKKNSTKSKTCSSFNATSITPSPTISCPPPPSSPLP